MNSATLFVKLAAGVACLMLPSAACDRQRTSVPLWLRLSPTPTVPSPPSITVFGTVSESSSGQPIAGVSVSIVPVTPPGAWGSRQVQTDPTGRYRYSGVPVDLGPTWVLPFKEGYVKPCVTTVDVADADMRKDVTIIAVGNLAAFNAGVPPQPHGSRTISGVVFEMTEDGRRLIEGAWVGWEGWFEKVVADTRSDAAGRYVLCGLPESPITGLFATKQGFKVDHTAAHAGSDAIVDIELRRQ